LRSAEAEAAAAAASAESGADTGSSLVPEPDVSDCAPLCD
jgi:hypothetical protein